MLQKLLNVEDVQITIFFILSNITQSRQKNTKTEFDSFAQFYIFCLNVKKYQHAHEIINLFIFLPKVYPLGKSQVRILYIDIFEKLSLIKLSVMSLSQ